LFNEIVFRYEISIFSLNALNGCHTQQNEDYKYFSQHIAAQAARDILIGEMRKSCT